MEPRSSDQSQPFSIEPIPADLLAWARQTLDVKDFLQEMDLIQKNGGHSLDSFIDEVEKRANAT
jgi:hypothetical protein